MKNVQISQELFMQLLRFHLMKDESCEKEIKKELEKSWTEWSCVTFWKIKNCTDRGRTGTGKKKEYLDRRGVLESFCW